MYKMKLINRSSLASHWSKCHSFFDSIAVLLITGLISLATGGPSANVVGLPMGPGVRMDPYFMDDQPVQKNITLLTGHTAYLECNVRNLGANKVSWIRHEDVQILAVGGHTFTTDSRFSSVVREDEGKFTLLIRKVQPKDEGTYECQISTKPTRSIFVQLRVKTPKIEILSDSALHVERDSALNLTCIVTAGGTNEYEQLWPKIFWFKDSQPIDNLIGGRAQITESVSGLLTDTPKTLSNLMVTKATVHDSGNYTCSSSALSDFATVKVHVLVDGESPNAWKTNSSTRIHHKATSLLVAAILSLIVSLAKL